MEQKRKNDSFFLQNKKPKGKNTIESEKPKSSNENSRQDTLDKNRPALKTKKEDDGKKPFDKKAYRLKKYSKKYKLEQWEEQRKKKMLHDYHKTIKNDPLLGSYKPKAFDEDTIDSNDQGAGKFVKHPDLIEKHSLSHSEVKNLDKSRKDPFKKAKLHLEKIKQEKLEKRQAIEKTKQEKAQKLQEYKKKKQERFKKLSKKTKRGQPVMTGRLELLLEKIQKS